MIISGNTHESRLLLMTADIIFYYVAKVRQKNEHTKFFSYSMSHLRCYFGSMLIHVGKTIIGKMNMLSH